MTEIDPLLTWTTPLDRSLAIDDARVTCPRRGSVDVEACLSCDFLLGLEGEWTARVVCSYPFPVGRRIADELAAGRRWSRRALLIDATECEIELTATDRHPEDLLPGDVRPGEPHETVDDEEEELFES